MKSVLVDSILDDAAQMYKTLMKENVLMLKGNEPPLNIEIDDKHYLPEYDAENPGKSCLGGIKVHARKGRIVLSNTLDDRIRMAYLENISKISSVTQIKQTITRAKARPVEEHKVHH